MSVWNKSLMARLVTYFLVLSLLIVALVGAIAFLRAREALTQAVFERLNVTATLKEDELARWVEDQRDQLVLIASLPEVQAQAEILANESPGSQAYQEAYFILSRHLSALRLSNEDLQEVFLLSDPGGQIVVSTEKRREGEYRVTDDYFIRGRSETYIRKLYPSPVTGRPTLTISTPLLSVRGQPLGVLATHLRLERVDTIILERSGLGSGGESYLVDQFNSFVSADRFGREAFQRGVHTVGIDAAVRGEDGSALYLNYEGVPVIGVYRWIEELDVALLAEMPQAEAFVPAQQLAYTLVLVGLAAAILLALGVYLFARQIVRPIHALATTAQQISAGDFSKQVQVAQEDEIGVLAAAFNSMTSQLRSSINTLEQRVAERTEDLERRSVQLQVAAEVARDATTTQSVDALLERAVTLIRERFGFYHVGIFLVDESGRYAVLRAASSVAAATMLERRHKLRVGAVGIVGYVTSTGRPRIALDVGDDAVHFKNPLLPNTHSEMALPLKVGNQVIGALDVQSEESAAFDEEDIVILQTLADQLAVGIDNARAYEQQLAIAAKLRELDELKMQFLANMSHELRTPLNSIIGFSRVILKGIDGPLTEMQRHDLTTIHSSAHHLLHLINEILDISKIEAGKMELDLGDTDFIRSVVNPVLGTVKGLLQDRPIELITQLSPFLPTIQADEIRLRQVLLNLLSNAAKFTESGHIRLTVREVGDEIEVSIADTGIGIPAEQQSKLFGQFYQVDGSATRKHTGTGLGLYISKSFIEMHGGRIQVDSTGVAGEGSTFTFWLPVSGPEVPAASPHQEEATPLPQSA